MPEAHKKSDDHLENASPLKKVANLKGNIVGEIDGIQVVFNKSGGITATKKYKDVLVEVTNSKREGRREEVIPSVKITLNFSGESFKDRVVIEGGRGKAEFTLEGKEYSVDYRMEINPHTRFSLGDKLVTFKFGYIGNEQSRLAEYFTFLVDEDFSKFKKDLVRAVESDSALVPFRLELERKRYLSNMVTGLMTAAMIIEMGQRDIKENPLALQEVFSKAKELGVADRLIEELRRGIKSFKNSLVTHEKLVDAVKIHYGMPPDYKIEEMDGLILGHVVERLERTADTLERLTKNPTKKDIKEAEENLAFGSALKKVEEMLGKNPDWRLNPAEFALQVIREVRPVQEPRKFAEMLKDKMGFERNESIVRQLATSDLSQYAPNLARGLGIYRKELEGDYTKEKALEKRARELLLLSEEILKRC